MMSPVRGLGRVLLTVSAAMAFFAPAAQAAPSFVPPGKAFGFNTNLNPPGEPAGSTRTLDAAEAAGATHMRMVITWRAWEQESSVANPIPPSFSKPVGEPTGSFRTDQADREYLSITGRGMTPVMIVHNAPTWASTFHTCQTNILDRLDTSKCPTDWDKKPIVLYPASDRFSTFRAFVAAVARRYPAAVIEGTNEPDFQKAFWARFHPPMSVVAGGQCELAAAVRSVDPNRFVLSAAHYLLDYAKDYLSAISGRNCFDWFNLHLFGWTEVRTGTASNHRVQLENLRGLLRSYAGGKGFWITESGMSDTVLYNDVNFNDDAEMLGEPIVAKAYPDFIMFFLNEPDIGGVLIQTLREGSFGEGGEHKGMGVLTANFTVKDPGGGILPRFCWLALSSGNTYPGCEGRSLPGPAPPGPPTFYKAPHLLFGSQTTVGKDAGVLFYEEGEPRPEVYVQWQRCNGIGLGCVPAAHNRSVYRLTEADRFKRLRVLVHLSNPHGTLTSYTQLSPIVD